jgi:hypothetical protein
MSLTVEQIIERLPARDYWLTTDIAKAFDVDKRTIQYCASRKGIGTKVRQGPRGTYVFQPDDLPLLCEHIHGEVGNPNVIAMKKQKDVMLEHLAKSIVKTRTVA